MNNYTISMKVNNHSVSLNNYADFGTMFEVFLEYVENANKFTHPIDEPVLIYKDAIIATDVLSIIRIGASISGFDVMFTHPVTGYCITSIPVSVLLESPETLRIPGETIDINIVGKRQQVYQVFQKGMMVSNMKTFFKHWASVVHDAQIVVFSGVDHVINPVLQQNVDMNWTMEYYVPAELKKALASIDTNPAETKKILMVMDYMLSKGKI